MLLHSIPQNDDVTVQEEFSQLNVMVSYKKNFTRSQIISEWIIAYCEATICDHICQKGLYTCIVSSLTFHRHSTDTTID